MRAHPQHALLPIHRHAIYNHLGPPASSLAQRRRARLALLAAQRVLPVWQDARSGDAQARQLLLLAEGVLTDAIGQQIASTSAEQVWHWLMDVNDSQAWNHQAPAFSALAATVRAVFDALGDDPWEGMVLMAHETDAEIDPWSADTAEWAAEAVAGPIWEVTSDSAKRLEFWTWWLTEAVPMAWEQETPLDLS